MQPYSGNVVPDTHTHTHLCKHARGIVADYAAVAIARGVPELGCTDHTPVPDGYDPETRMEMEQFETYRGWVRDAQQTDQLTVLYGVEADYYPGCEAYLPEFLASEPFDLVIGSIHFIGDWAFDHPATLDRWQQADVNAVWREYFVLLDGLVATGWFDILGHLDLPKKFGFRPHDDVLREMAAPVMDRIATSGMAIELNTGGLRKPVHEIYPSALLLEMAHARDIPVCFGSDAHTPSYVGQDFDKALQLVRDAGYADYVRFRGRTSHRVPLPVTEG